jgi:hypothetical protein
MEYGVWSMEDRGSRMDRDLCRTNEKRKTENRELRGLSFHFSVFRFPFFILTHPPG